MRRYGEINVPGMENKAMTYNGLFFKQRWWDERVGGGEQEDVNTMRQFCTSLKCCAKIAIAVPCHLVQLEKVVALLTGW